MSIDKLKTKFFTGAWLTDVKHYFTKINEIIDYLNGDGKSGDGSYKVYTALLSQSGSNPPTETILQNTIGGNISYGFTNTGTYSIELGTLFIDGKVGIFLSPVTNNANHNLSCSSSLIYDGTTGYILRTYDDTGALTNKGLSKTMIEIRIYN